MVSVLTNNEKENVVSLYKMGWSTPKISREYGISSTAINGILKRRGIELRDASLAGMVYKVNTTYFQELDCEEKVYWLGFLAADGNVSDKSELRVSLSAKDFSHLEKLKKALDSTHPIRHYEQKGLKYVSLGIRNKEIAKNLYNHGIVPRKTHILRPPTTIPISLIKHYIRGYIDGDGGFDGLKQPSFRVTSTKQIVLWIQEHLILNCDLRRKTKLIQRHKETEIYTLCYTGLRQVLRIGSYLYDNSSIYLDRKKEYIDSLPDPVRKRRIDA